MSNLKKEIVIQVKKKRMRIPLPKKPPKIINTKKSYDRKKEKDKLRRNEEEE